MATIDERLYYDVTGHVSGIGDRKHRMRAMDRNEAEAKFVKAYSKHECSDVIVRRASALRRNKTCAPAV